MANSQRLKKVREKAGLTQVQAAKMLKMSIDTYRNWEQGITNVSDLQLAGVKQEFIKS